MLNEATGQNVQFSDRDTVESETRQTKAASDNTATVNGEASNESVSLSDRYEYIILSPQERNLLKNTMEKEIDDETHYLDAATNWLYANSKGVSVFALYGVGDGAEPTPLYAVGGKKADAESNRFKKFLEEYQNGTVIYRENIDAYWHATH